MPFPTTSYTPTDLVFRSMSDWNPTIPQLRECILNRNVIGPRAFGIDPREYETPWYSLPTEEAVAILAEAAYQAAVAGRMFDLGFLPNEVIQATGKRGGQLYCRGLIGHPFRDPWLFVHRWVPQKSFNAKTGAVLPDNTLQMTAFYMAHLLQPDRPAGGDCEVLEFSPLVIGSDKLLVIGDRARIVPDLEAGPSAYWTHPQPAFWRLHDDYKEVNLASGPYRSAASNVADPLVTALMILNTKGIPRETIAVSDKLNRARRRSRKPEIPPYEKVDTSLYVTALQRHPRPKGGEAQGGTHASPQFHLRQGHVRTYASGIMRMIPDALVNATDEARAAFRAGRQQELRGNRSHYEVRS